MRFFKLMTSVIFSRSKISEPVENSKSSKKQLTVLSRRSSLNSSTPHSSFSLPTFSSSLDASATTSAEPPDTPAEPPATRPSFTSTQLSALLGQPGACIAALGDEPELILGDAENHVKVLRCSDLTTSIFASVNSPVKSLLVSGTTVFTAHHDLKIRVWKLAAKTMKKKKLLAVLPTLRDRLVTSILPNSHVQTRRHKRELRIQHFDAISALATGPGDNTLLYSASWDKTIKVWSLSDFRCLQSFQAHEDAVNSLAVSSDGYLYSASSDGTVKVWERLCMESKHVLTATLRRHTGGVNALALSSDQLLLYSASSDKSIIVWEREDSADHLNVSQVLKGHSGAVLCLATTESGCFVCSGSADRSIRLWRRESGKSQRHLCMGVVGVQSGAVRSVVVLEASYEEGCRVYGRSVDGSVKGWLMMIRKVAKSQILFPRNKVAINVESGEDSE